ncbi:hypothetical protein [uncultured Anaerococcus sp.]|uniref:hypothetical protein n=1 Tax=uncultured Anaerococcus sp. TaxID=293428 RepID=UPI00288B38A6|nr:hypothetical protein [uncultured Anaerococcus sp.]
MKIAAANSVITILILFVPLILQILICKYIKGRAGLILPGLSFIISIIYMLSIPDDVNWWMAVLTTMVIANIPTIIYYLIYRYYDNKEKQKDELDKMEIMDM